MADYWLVVHAQGPEWNPAKGRRQIGEVDGDDVLLIVDAASKDEVRARFAEGTFAGTILQVESVRPWQVWVRGAGAS